ncbi:MAG: lipoyl synthase [Actinomycetota bacterium]|nr:lipoyl synthase [Actinomycetota bacterium]
MSGKNSDWLKIRYSNNNNTIKTAEILRELNLNTVCEEALCPNRWECFSKKTATFMILGRICTRNCRFCNVEGGIPESLDSAEAVKVAEAVKRLGLKHVVITSVTRDDLEDGGSSAFAEAILQIKKLRSKDTVTVEVLIPDFKGLVSALKTVIKQKPDILNHNLETVKELYQKVRPQADYHRSLELLSNAKKIDPAIITKSGIMVGLGEKKNEVINLFKDLRKTGCDFITIGQYLSPSKKHLKVTEFVNPEKFKEYEEICKKMGFKFVQSAPLVRSSYHAADFI